MDVNGCALGLVTFSWPIIQIDPRFVCNWRLRRLYHRNWFVLQPTWNPITWIFHSIPVEILWKWQQRWSSLQWPSHWITISLTWNYNTLAETSLHPRNHFLELQSSPGSNSSDYRASSGWWCPPEHSELRICHWNLLNESKKTTNVLKRNVLEEKALKIIIIQNFKEKRKIIKIKKKKQKAVKF